MVFQSFTRVLALLSLVSIFAAVSAKPGVWRARHARDLEHVASKPFKQFKIVPGQVQRRLQRRQASAAFDAGPTPGPQALVAESQAATAPDYAAAAPASTPQTAGLVNNIDILSNVNAENAPVGDIVRRAVSIPSALDNTKSSINDNLSKPPLSSDGVAGKSVSLAITNEGRSLLPRDSSSSSGPLNSVDNELEEVFNNDNAKDLTDEEFVEPTVGKSSSKLL